jgi:Enoyl-CoA hydratase/isomerase
MQGFAQKSAKTVGSARSPVLQMSRMARWHVRSIAILCFLCVLCAPPRLRVARCVEAKSNMIEIEPHRKNSVFRTAHGKANALDTELCEAITVRLEEHRHSSMQALVFIGQGQIFSAGVDLLRVLDGGPAYLEVFLPALSKAFETLFCFPKPVIAAINGHAIAGGCVLACAADYRIMAHQAGRIGVPELLVGVPFPTVALEIMRCVAAPEQFQALL